MAFLGKLLVMLNGVFALAFLMWGVSLYTNRVNWFTDKGGDKENVGQVDKFTDQFKARNASLIRATQRWDRNYNGYQENGKEVFAGVGSLEKERFARREFYRDSIARVREGKDGDGKPIVGAQLVKIVERDPNNITRIDIRPILPRQVQYFKVGGSRLDSILGYNQRTSDTRANIEIQQKEVLRLVKAYEALTVEIFGTEMMKGLRTQIKEQEAVGKSAIAGTEYLLPIITDRDAQKDIFIERNENLLRRLGQLELHLQKRGTGLSRE